MFALLPLRIADACRSGVELTNPNPLLAAIVMSLGQFVGMLAFPEIGYCLSRRSSRKPEVTHEGIGVVEAAVFALLGLLLGFSFADGTSRLEARRQLIVQETNAISTAYDRLDLLPANDHAIAAILVANPFVTSLWHSAGKVPQYVPPDILSASNIPYPVDTLAVGAVSLLLNLDSNAQIQNMQILRDFPSLTSSVQDAVTTWTFRPAVLKGNSVPSEIPLTVIFNIFNPAGGAASQSLVLAPAQPTIPDASQFTPPQITQASFANYPAASVAQGTVVLDVTVGRAGQPKQIRVINDVPPLTQQAVIAVKTWEFNAATIHGQPIAAQIVIAFVFHRNMS